MRYRIIQTRRSITGFGIVEIMLAMVISLVLLSGVIQIYMGSKQSYVMTENMSRMQENARFAMDMLAREIRMSGFMPCKRNGEMVNTLIGGQTNEFLNFFDGALLGYEGGVSAFPSVFPAAGNGAGDRVAESDAIIILRGGDDTYHVTSHNAPSARFTLNKPHNFVDDQIALVCDGEHAAVFQLTNVSSSNTTVVHNTGESSPGNCTKNLAGSGFCTSDTEHPTSKAYGYSDEAQVVTFEAHAFYVGVSSNGQTRSLYRVSMLTNVATAAEELLEGVESLQMLYGDDSTGDGLANRYITANAVTNWNRIVTVRVGLLVHTPEQVSPETDNRIYNVAGTVIGTSGAVQHAADQRLRFAFNSTVKVRNRGVQ